MKFMNRRDTWTIILDNIFGTSCHVLAYLVYTFSPLPKCANWIEKTHVTLHRHSGLQLAPHERVLLEIQQQTPGPSIKSNERSDDGKSSFRLCQNHGGKNSLDAMDKNVRSLEGIHFILSSDV